MPLINKTNFKICVIGWNNHQPQLTVKYLIISNLFIKILYTQEFIQELSSKNLSIQ